MIFNGSFTRVLRRLHIVNSVIPLRTPVDCKLLPHIKGVGHIPWSIGSGIAIWNDLQEEETSVQRRPYHGTRTQLLEMFTCMYSIMDVDRSSKRLLIATITESGWLKKCFARSTSVPCERCRGRRLSALNRNSTTSSWTQYLCHFSSVLSQVKLHLVFRLFRAISSTEFPAQEQRSHAALWYLRRDLKYFQATFLCTLMVRIC